MVIDYHPSEPLPPGAYLYDYYSPTCQPCLQIAKLLPKWSEDTGITVVKVNIEEYPELAQIDQIRKVPTFVFTKYDSQLGREIEVDRFVGVPRLVQLTDMVTA